MTTAIPIFIILLNPHTNILNNIKQKYKKQRCPRVYYVYENAPLIVAKLEEFIRNKLIKIYSSRTFNEMKTFIWKNGKPQAMKSYHDDLIMALAIGCWVRDTALQANARDLNYQRAFVDAIITSKTTFQHSNQWTRRLQKR